MIIIVMSKTQCVTSLTKDAAGVVVLFFVDRISFLKKKKKSYPKKNNNLTNTGKVATLSRTSIFTKFWEAANLHCMVR